MRAEIEKVYGKEFVPAQPNVYKSKKNAQDAHEAIRPTSVDIHPDAIKKHLKDEQYKLYKMIWNRFVASQMMPARLRPDHRPTSRRRPRAPSPSARRATASARPGASSSSPAGSR